MDCPTALTLVLVAALLLAALALVIAGALTHRRGRFLVRKAGKIGRDEDGPVHLFGKVAAPEDAPRCLLSDQRAAYLITDVRSGSGRPLHHVYGKKIAFADDTGTTAFALEGVRFLDLARREQTLAQAPAHTERELAEQFGLGPFPFPENRAVRITERGLPIGHAVSVFGVRRGGRFAHPPVVVRDVRAARRKVKRRRDVALGLAVSAVLFSGAALLFRPAAIDALLASPVAAFRELPGTITQCAIPDASPASDAVRTEKRDASKTRKSPRKRRSSSLSRSKK